jgi:hypothetical protein
MSKGEENPELRCSRKRNLRRALVIQTTPFTQHSLAPRNLNNKLEVSKDFIMI